MYCNRTKNILESRDILVHFPNAGGRKGGGVGGGHGLSHKVLTYVEYRAVSGVLQNIYPPPPSPPSECVLPPHQRWGVLTRRAVGGGGWVVNILVDARHWIGLLQYNLSTVSPYPNIRKCPARPLPLFTLLLPTSSNWLSIINIRILSMRVCTNVHRLN